MALFKETLFHQVGEDTSDVSISVTIGDDQHLAYFVLKKPNGSYRHGELHQESLGLGSNVRDKMSQLTVTVTDTNPLTNHTSITITLTNGEEEKSYSEVSDHDGGTVIYMININHG